MIDRARAERVIAGRRARSNRTLISDDFTAEWFPEQRAFYDDPSRLVAALCGRRAGKTRGGNRHFIRQAMNTTHGRFLYLNSTLDEARKLAWIGARGDGMKSLIDRYRLPANCNESTLSIHFPALDSWIFLRGADDEDGVTKALGLPYHEVWWDESQKIPTKLAPTIRDVLMPTLLDYRGRLRLTGTPVRNMAGMFFSITQPDLSLRTKGWSVHHWNLLANPFFGRTVDERHVRGMLDLQELLGGPEVAPLDSATMRREGKGEWVHEDSNHVYWAHRVRRDQLCYAPARLRDDGFPDVLTAMRDLPGYPERPYFCAFGNDLGTRDPYAFCLWAWSLADPVLYEVASYSKTGLDYDQMGAHMRAVGEVVPIGITVADAGGGGKPAVMGWSKTWQDRYRLPIIEATKQNKYGAIQMLNTDMVNGRIKVREGGALLREWLVHQWSSVVSATGRLVEDPTTPNHCCFVAGTMVETEHGPRAIETLTVGDRVWTRVGLRSVTAAWCTGERPTWRLESDVGVLVGTGNHPVWTESGWTDLSKVLPGAMLAGWGSSVHQKSLCSKVESTGVSPATTVRVDTSGRATDGLSTGVSGRRITDLYRKDFTSITSTEIHSITGSKTYKRYRVAITVMATIAAMRQWASSKLMSLVEKPNLLLGTRPRMASGSIVNMVVESCSNDQSSGSVANPAETNFTPRKGEQGFVPESAEPETARQGASASRPHGASSAEGNFSVTQRCRPDVVPCLARHVERLGTVRSVYNLTVEGEHEYFANSILVSNCDAALYAHRESYHHRFREPEKIALPGSPEWVIREEKELEDAQISHYR